MRTVIEETGDMLHETGSIWKSLAESLNEETESLNEALGRNAFALENGEDEDEISVLFDGEEEFVGDEDGTRIFLGGIRLGLYASNEK